MCSCASGAEVQEGGSGERELKAVKRRGKTNCANLIGNTLGVVGFSIFGPYIDQKAPIGTIDISLVRRCCGRTVVD